MTPPNDLLLRPAFPADYQQVAEIWHSSVSLPTVGPAILPSLAAMRESIDRSLAAGWVVTVAEADGRLVGFLAIKPTEAILDQLFVRPGALGAGIGRALFRRATELMPDGFILFTRSGNRHARQFYERAGMVHLRDGLHPVNGEGDPISYYRWTPSEAAPTSTPK